MALQVGIKSGFEVIAVVEDLKTLRSTAAVRVFIETDTDIMLYDRIYMFEVPDDV